MRARAVLIAERVGSSTSLTTIRSDPPLLFRSTHAGVMLVGGSAGPLGGDDLSVDIRVGDGAELRVSTVAASMLLPRDGASRLRVRMIVGDGASLAWCPQPSISVRGSEHVVTSTIEVSGSGRFVGREVTVLGRHGEDSGIVDSTLRVERDGRAVVATGHRIGDPVGSTLVPAGVGSFRRLATSVEVAATEDPKAGDHVEIEPSRWMMDVGLAPGVRQRTTLDQPSLSR